MSTPRSKGVMPEDHPLYLGVTGLGGHAEVESYLRRTRPARVLVLGSRLSEMASFWSRSLVPQHGIVHVDLDPEAFGSAYPDVPTLGVQSEIGAFLRALIAAWPKPADERAPQSVPKRVSAPPSARPPQAAVRPSYLMTMIQREIVEKTTAPVLTEAGNSFVLGSHHLKFDRPGRYRVSTSFGSMGQAAAGVLGAALSSPHGKAVAIVGDGAMLMNNEINTAANYGIGAVWIVLNDARYGMVEEGMKSVGWQPFETDFPRVDFVAIARVGPFVIDVLVDATEPPPAGKRNDSLKAQGLSTAPPAGRP
jgi:acetolactate synthase-1/2/3 large subunit